MVGKFSLDTFISKGPVIGILRGKSLKEIEFIAECFYEAGLYALEVTMDTPDLDIILPRLRKNYPLLTIGAGTVCSTDDLHQAVQLGAQFIVTPVLDANVVRQSQNLEIPVFPGAFSPTEIYKAWQLGATAVKVFPTSGLGPGYIKNVLEPLGEIRLLPTGGISKENIQSYRKAGAFGVGMGGGLFEEKLLKNRDATGLTEHLKTLKSLWHTALH